MILQTDDRLRPEIRESNGYYLALVALAEAVGGKRRQVSTLNGPLFEEAYRQGWMTHDCWINHPAGILNHLCGDVFGVYPEKIGYECKDGEWEILEFQGEDGYSYYALGDGNGGIVYQPMEGKEGRLISKRIFRRI